MSTQPNANGNGISLRDLQAQIAMLEAKLAAANAPRRLSLKVSEKGAISVYGLGRFPTTLYVGPMMRLLDAADDIRAFAKANVALLATKPTT